MITSNKNWFIREIAKRADFSLGDVRLIWDVIEEIIFERALSAVNELEKTGEEETEALNLHGFFSFRVSRIKSHTGYHPFYRKHIKLENSYRYVFKPSRVFVHRVREKLKKDLPAEE